jgi:hypothetical protein
VLPGVVACRDSLLATLTALLPKLDADSRLLGIQGLAALQTLAPGQVGGLAEVAAPGDLPTLVQGLVDQALAAALAAVDTGLAQITAMLPGLPADAQAQVTQALGLVQGTLASITPILQQTTALVSSTLQQVLGLVGGLLPAPAATAPGTAGTTAGATAATGLSGGLLGGLLGGLTGLLPGLGGAGGLGGLLG